MTRLSPPRQPPEDALECIARSLASLASQAAELARCNESDAPIPGVTVAARVRGYLAGRRARANILEGGWFADPAWDLLLDLLASQHEGRRISISSACIAASVPPTTALRWLERLLAAGIIYRIEDVSDGRRAFVGLAPPVAERLEQWVAHHLPHCEPMRPGHTQEGRSATSI